MLEPTFSIAFGVRNFNQQFWLSMDSRPSVFAFVRRSNSYLIFITALIDFHGRLSLSLTNPLSSPWILHLDSLTSYPSFAFSGILSMVCLLNIIIMLSVVEHFFC